MRSGPAETNERERAHILPTVVHDSDAFRVNNHHAFMQLEAVSGR